MRDRIGGSARKAHRPPEGACPMRTHRSLVVVLVVGTGFAAACGSSESSPSSSSSSSSSTSSSSSSGTGGGGESAITVTPPKANVLTCETEQLTATVTGTSNTAVTWKVDPAGVGEG